MLYALGRVFFPMMIHREKALRARMRWLAIVMGLILVVAVAVLVWRVQQRQSGGHYEKPLKPARTY